MNDTTFAVIIGAAILVVVLFGVAFGALLGWLWRDFHGGGK